VKYFHVVCKNYLLTYYQNVFPIKQFIKLFLSCSSTMLLFGSKIDKNFRPKKNCYKIDSKTINYNDMNVMLSNLNFCETENYLQTLNKLRNC